MVEGALDTKAAKSLQSACKTHLKRPSNKRAAGDSPSNPSSEKRIKTVQHLDSGIEAQQQIANELEHGLALPIIIDEDEISDASIYTNRAPLMLAFVTELLRHTMPEQPLSSRLSLAQAVVSANSKSKAVSLGLANNAGGDGSWEEGQPHVKIMGRTLRVLKRGDYASEGNVEVATAVLNETSDTASNAAPSLSNGTPLGQDNAAFAALPWSASRQVTFKSSTFVARVASLSDKTQAPGLINALLSAEPHLQMATHNAWACRVRKRGHHGEPADILEACEDDGETGCGEFILRLIREADVADVVVVLTRWFGGEFLGPDRWRLIRNSVTEALSHRLRLPQGQLGRDGVPLWALDLQRMSGGSGSHNAQGTTERNNAVVGAAIYRPESARAYLLKSFVSGQSSGEITIPGETAELRTSKAKEKKPSKSTVEADKLRNVGRLLGALRLLFDSWTDHLTPLEMDRRAYSWYTTIRPDIAPGTAGWGAKNWLKLSTILDLRRRDNPCNEK